MGVYAAIRDCLVSSQLVSVRFRAFDGRSMAQIRPGTGSTSSSARGIPVKRMRTDAPPRSTGSTAAPAVEPWLIDCGGAPATHARRESVASQSAIGVDSGSSAPFRNGSGLRRGGFNERSKDAGRTCPIHRRGLRREAAASGAVRGIGGPGLVSGWSRPVTEPAGARRATSARGPRRHRRPRAAARGSRSR